MKKTVLGALSAAALMTIASGAQAGATGFTTGTFSLDGPKAYTYDTEVAPALRSGASVDSRSGFVTTVTLTVWGLQPNTTYTAHGHVNACGADPHTAGGHWKFDSSIEEEIGPNELWFMVRTDAAGNGSRTSTRFWNFDANPPRSVVIHGEGGAKKACITAAL